MNADGQMSNTKTEVFMFFFLNSEAWDHKFLSMRATSNLGAFAKLQKATTSYVMSVCPHGTPTGRIAVKFYILIFFEKSVEKIQVALKSDKNNGYFTWPPTYIFYHISLNSSYKEKYFEQKL